MLLNSLLNLYLKLHRQIRAARHLNAEELRERQSGIMLLAGMRLRELTDLSGVDSQRRSTPPSLGKPARN